MTKAKTAPKKTEKNVKTTSKKTEEKAKTTPKIKKPDFAKYKKFVKPLVIAGAIVFSFVLIDLFVQYLNNDYSIAVVDGSRISKNAYNKKLDILYGQAVAKQMIDEEIIMQEATKANIEITKEEIQSELDALIEEVGGQEAYESILKANSISEKDLRSQIKLTLATQKILEPTITYTDEELKAFFDQYSAQLFKNESAALENGEKLDYESHKEKTKEEYLKNRVRQMQYVWINNLYGEYRIQDNTTAKPKYGFLTTTISIINNLTNSVNSNGEEIKE